MRALPWYVRLALSLLAGAGIGLGLRSLLWPAPPAIPTLTHRDTVRVSVPVLVQGKPDTVVRFVDRIIRVPVKPDVTLVSDGAGTGIIQQFCKPQQVDTVRVGDSVRIVTTAPPPAVLIDAGAYRRGTLTLWSVRNTDSAGIRQPYRVGTGSYTFRAHADSIIVQRDRFARLKWLAERAAWAGGGYVVGRYVPR
jgi:hypothetical protein